MSGRQDRATASSSEELRWCSPWGAGRAGGSVSFEARWTRGA